MASKAAAPAPPPAAPNVVSEETEKNDKLPASGEIIPTKHHKYEAVKLLGKGGFGAVFLVGKNLWDLRIEREPPKFSLNTSLKAAEQCLMAIQDLHTVGFLHRDIKPGNFAIGRPETNEYHTAIQDLHTVGFLHRDIKPGNFAIGRPETNEYHTVFMLDFGLCRKFIGETLSKDLRMPRTSAPFRGTTRYAAIAALKQIEQSRKDDIEAWLYMVAEWTVGALPWRRLKGQDKEEVLRWKEDIRNGDAHDEFMTGLPRREFGTIMSYVDSLEYHSIPDYDHVHYLLQHACKSNSIIPNDPVDWDLGNKYHGPTHGDREKKQKVAIAQGKTNITHSKESKEF
uniref:Protein kinase domain-containing protein n=1 Tax=Panagrolaimus sp. ES5 TaxID=591445 RepID=A0AC34FTL8_9BILA